MDACPAGGQLHARYLQHKGIVCKMLEHRLAAIDAFLVEYGNDTWIFNACVVDLIRR